MPKSFHLEILTPEKKFFPNENFPSDEVQSLVFMTPVGEIGILAGHVASVAAVASGSIRFLTEEGWQEAAISGGFAEITGTHVVVMADAVEWPQDISLARAEDARRRAEERLQTQLGEIELARTQAALQRALARLKTVNKS